MKIIQCLQGSDEWKLARCGMITASRIKDVMSYTQSGEAAGRRNYRAELVCEILTGQPYSQYANEDMQWGIEHENDARSLYSAFKKVGVGLCGFGVSERLKRSGSSPDGIVGEKGMLEIKCPKTATHLQYLLDGMVPPVYRSQMLWNMNIWEREWCDFVSFDPRLPPNLRLFIIKYYRDDRRIKEIEKEVVKFNRDIDLTLSRLKHLTEPKDWIDELGDK